MIVQEERKEVAETKKKNKDAENRRNSGKVE